MKTLAREMIQHVAISAVTLKPYEDRNADVQARVDVLLEMVPLKLYPWVERELERVAKRDPSYSDFTFNMRFAVEHFKARARIREEAERQAEKMRR